MKLVKEVPPTCPCRDKIARFVLVNKHLRLQVGSIIECDCLNQYELSDDQREGPYWRKIDNVGVLG